MSAEARRRQLIDVALRLFSRKGFRGTTTQEIARAAGVNEAIIFRHFASKEDLYSAILEREAGEAGVEAWLAELEAFARARDDEGLFRCLASKIIAHDRGNREFIRLMIHAALDGHTLVRNFLEKHGRPIYEFFHGYIVMRQREGAFADADPKTVVRAFLGMIDNHVLATRLFDCEMVRISDQEAINTFTRLLLDGLRAAPRPAGGSHQPLPRQ